MKLQPDEKGAMLALWAIALVVLACMGLFGCSSTEGIRLDKSPQDTAREAAGQPLPVCEIPPNATSTQLDSALWGCVLEYRALFPQCAHMVSPPQAIAYKPSRELYGMRVCETTFPAKCYPAEVL